MNNRSDPYRDALRYLYGLQKYGIKFGLSKTANLLKSFGNPHIGRSYVHIAGTNGKGSVGAMLASILKESGLKVGLYTSPHLVRFTERFRINDREIDPDKVAGLVEEVKEAGVDYEPPTFFEAVTAMALVFFAREKTDIDVVEVGMGGRLDATNVITPLVSVITNISKEHEEFLGSRLIDIAGEKAGIIKEGVGVATAVTQRPVITLFETLCREKKARLWRVGNDVRYRLTRKGFYYYGMGRRLIRLELGLAGGYQARNAALALLTAEILEEKGLSIHTKHIVNGLKHARWPGRMHVVSERPTILVDGAHNPWAVRSLARSIGEEFRFRRLIVVLGVMEDKATRAILRNIVPLSDYAIYSRPDYYRAAEPERLWKEAAHLGVPGEVAATLPQALERAKEISSSSDIVVVTGSLFTAGEAMTYFYPREFRPDPKSFDS